MDTNALSDDDTVEQALPQPTSSKVSAVINGMGNGATAGIAVYALPRLIAGVRGKPMPAESYVGTVFATVAGTALGMWYGLHEAKQLENYRDSIGEALISTRDRVHALETKLKHLEKRPAAVQPATHAEKVTVKRDEAAEEALER